MANSSITRANQKIFASNASTNQLAAFGSIITHSPVYTDDVDTLQTAAYEEGWSAAVANNTAPFMQEDNAVLYGLSYQIAYLLQKGLPEYSATENYFQYSLCQKGGIVYQSKTNNNLNNDPAQDDGTNWTVKYFMVFATDQQAEDGLLEDVAINPKQLQTEIQRAVVGALQYQGVWTATGQTDYSTIPTPATKGFMYYVEGSATIGGISWVTGDYLIVNENVASGGTVTQVTRVLNNEDTDIVRLDATQTLTNKTISALSNTISNLTTSNFASGIVRTSIRSTAGASDTNLVTELAIATALASPTPVTTLTTSGTITLADNSINSITPSDAVTFTLPTITDNTVFHQILVQVNLSTVYTLTLGTSYFFNSTAPDMSNAGVYNLVYEYDKANQYWVCGAIVKASIA